METGAQKSQLTLKISKWLTFIFLPPFSSFSRASRFWPQEGLHLPVNGLTSFFSPWFTCLPFPLPRKYLFASQGDIHWVTFAGLHLLWNSLEKLSTCLFRVHVLRLLTTFSPERLEQSSGHWGAALTKESCTIWLQRWVGPRTFVQPTLCDSAPHNRKRCFFYLKEKKCPKLLHVLNENIRAASYVNDPTSRVWEN